MTSCPIRRPAFRKILVLLAEPSGTRYFEIETIPMSDLSTPGFMVELLEAISELDGQERNPGDYYSEFDVMPAPGAPSIMLRHKDTMDSQSR